MAKETHIGALWAPPREGETMPLGNGNVIMPNGEKLYITVWRNRWKQPGEKSPDFYIDLDARNQVNDTAGHPERATNKPQMEARRVPPSSQPQTATVTTEPTDFFDDIPF